MVNDNCRNGPLLFFVRCFIFFETAINYLLFLSLIIDYSIGVIC
jgi:hypothetical protein